MASTKEDVYATLLLNDVYLPGALVLAHSLKDAGTKKKLAVLVTTDTVSVDAMVELQKLYDFIVPVKRLRNDSPANLFLMDRTDLHSAFTKIELWKLEQFGRIVYMDADMVALRAPDELFNLPEPFSAAPDIGWPDLFNTGLMVLNPNMGDYYAMLAMAERGISFDGADQGLLNIHFKNNYNRLSFTYNVTPSAHYQYLPAYRHFQSGISAAHFIGKDKPWTQGRNAHRGNDPYGELTGRWWAVYDKHYRVEANSSVQASVPYIIQYHVKGEYQAPSYSFSIQPAVSQQFEHGQSSENNLESSAEQPMHETAEVVANMEAELPPVSQEAPKPEFVIPFSSWDAAKAPPPADSKPEAINFPASHYEMSNDKTPFRAPEKYPEPPKNMWYDVPKTPTYQKPEPLFPWEKHAAKPSRVFAEDIAEERRLSKAAEAAKSEEPEEPKPMTPVISVTTADPWQSFGATRGNAWDDIPEIEQYIGRLQKNRKGNIQVLQGYGSELERPSLPVTPAPIRRPSFWGEERDEQGQLPAAEGVPTQADWDPTAQLEMLARRQSDVLSQKLGSPETKELPSRALPYGSEGVKSPTYVAPIPLSGGASPHGVSEDNPEQPSYSGPSAMYEKGETYATHETPMPPNEEEMDALS